MSDLSEFGLRHRTELAHVRALQAVHEHVLWMTDHADVDAGGAVHSVRQLMALGQQLKVFAVLKARLVYDASWDDVAVLLGVEESTARAIYLDAEQRWISGDMAPWLPNGKTLAARPLLRRILGGRKG